MSKKPQKNLADVALTAMKLDKAFVHKVKSQLGTRAPRCLRSASAGNNLMERAALHFGLPQTRWKRAGAQSGARTSE